MFTRWIRASAFYGMESIKFVFNKLKELPESPDIDNRIIKFVNFFQDLLNKNNGVYFLKNEENIFNLMFKLRGIDLNCPQKFVSIEQLQNLASRGKVQLANINSLMQWFIDTPIKKDMLEKLIKFS